MAKRMKVDIVIPAYNEEKNIGKLLGQIMEQSIYDRIGKIFVVSDASSDCTPEIVNELAKKNKKIIFIQKPKRAGKFDSLNRAFELSNAEVLIMLDSDILLKHNSLKKLVKPLEAKNKIGLAIAKNEPLSEGLNFASFASFFSIYIRYEIIKSKSDYKYNNFYSMCGRASAIRRNVFKKIKLVSGPGGDDQELFYLTLEQGYTTFYAEDSCVMYFVPKTVSDYLKQNKRFRNAQVYRANLHQSVFDKYGPQTNNPLLALFLTFLKHPLRGLAWAPLYSYGIWVAAKDKNKTDANWEMAKSTK